MRPPVLFSDPDLSNLLRVGTSNDDFAYKSMIPNSSFALRTPANGTILVSCEGQVIPFFYQTLHTRTRALARVHTCTPRTHTYKHIHTGVRALHTNTNIHSRMHAHTQASACLFACLLAQTSTENKKHLRHLHPSPQVLSALVHPFLSVQTASRQA